MKNPQVTECKETVDHDYLVSRAYMGHKVVINGRSTSWRNLRATSENNRKKYGSSWNRIYGVLYRSRSENGLIEAIGVYKTAAFNTTK